MPLRPLNETVTPQDVLNLLATLLPQNTQLQSAGGSVLVNDDALLRIGTAVSPTLLLEGEQPQTVKLGWRTWQVPAFAVTASYLIRWDQDPSTFDQLWQEAVDDTERMKANLEDNPTLWASGVSHTVGPPQISLSPRDQEALTDRFGVSMIQRRLFLVVALPPYVATTPSNPAQPY